MGNGLDPANRMMTRHSGSQLDHWCEPDFVDLMSGPGPWVEKF